MKHRGWLYGLALLIGLAPTHHDVVAAPREPVADAREAETQDASDSKSARPTPRKTDDETEREQRHRVPNGRLLVGETASALVALTLPRDPRDGDDDNDDASDFASSPLPQSNPLFARRPCAPTFPLIPLAALLRTRHVRAGLGALPPPHHRP